MSTTKTRTKTTTYESADIDFSASLLTCGVRLLDAYRNADKKTVFVFDNADGRCEMLRRQFFTNELTLPAAELLRSLRTLKWRLHNL